MGQRVILITVFVLMICVSLIVISSCKKKKVEEAEPETPAPNNSPKPDSIFYVDIIPDLSRNSVITSTAYLNVDNRTCYNAVPKDTTIAIGLDVDGNSVEDFRFFCTNINKFVSPHICPQGFMITVDGVAATDSIFRAEPKMFLNLNGRGKFYSLGDTIDGSDPCVDLAFLKLQNHHQASTSDYFFSGDLYFGVKRTLNNNTFFGWIKVETTQAANGTNEIIIKEFAINKTSGNSIIAGQK